MPIYYDAQKKKYVYEFDKFIDGKRVRTRKSLPSGWSHAQREKYAHEQDKKLYAQVSGVEERIPLIEEAVAAYVKHKCPTLKNGQGAIAELARIYDYYKDRPLTELQQVSIDYQEKMADTLTPATIRNKLSYLLAACNYAQKKHGIGNGIQISVSKPSVSNDRTEFATRAEMLACARACKNRHARGLIRVAFYTGMRLGELMAIGQKNKIVDNHVLLCDTKNGKNHLIPIHPKALIVLRTYFPMPYQARFMQRKVREAMDSVGLEHLHFHDLRHSTATALINSGVDLFTVGRVLNHKDSRSTQRYAHLTNKTLLNAIKKIK